MIIPLITDLIFGRSHAATVGRKGPDVQHPWPPVRHTHAHGPQAVGLLSPGASGHYHIAFAAPAACALTPRGTCSLLLPRLDMADDARRFP